MRNKLLTAFLLGLITAFLFGYTNDWTESTPTDATVANQIDDFNRKVRIDVAERLEDYIGGFNASDTNEGFYHILFIENAASLSTPAANKGLLYGKLADSKCELFWIDEDGDEKQITSGGVLKIAAGDFDANSIDEDDIELDNDSYLVATNAAGTADVNLIKAGTNNLATLPDSAEMASNAAPVEDEAIANKKYVDDNIGSANYTPNSYAGEQSVTFPNGLIMKWGTESIAGDATDDVTYGTAFPTAFVSAQATYNDNANNISDSCCAKAKTGSTTSILQVTNGAGGAKDVFWMAIGY